MSNNLDAPRLNHRLGLLAEQPAAVMALELTLQIDLTDDEMQASLTSGRQLLAVGSIESAGSALQQVQERLASAQLPGDQKAIGNFIETLLLPSKIRKSLATVPDAKIALIVNQPLQALPWEWVLSQPFTERETVYRLCNQGQLGVQSKSEKQGELQVDLLSREPLDQELLGVSTASPSLVNQSLVNINHVEHPSLIVKNGEVLVVTDVKAWDPSAFQLKYSLIVLGWVGDHFSTADHEAVQRWVQAGEAAGCAVWAALHQPASWCTWFESLQKIALGETIAQSRPHQMAMWSYEDRRLRSGTEGQSRGYRQAACLAYDLSRSTELMHSISLERYSEVLQSCHNRFRAVIAKWGGTCDSPQGDDSIMSYFGHLQSNEHATRLAVRAANELIHAATLLNVKIKVGIAHGLLAVSDAHSVGPAVHMAGRLRDRASPMTILLDEATCDQVREEFGFVLVEQQWTPKGYPAPVVVWRLANETDSGAKPVSSEINLFRTVGRQNELAQLASLWKKALDSRGNCVLISGEAGIGKSQIVQEWRHSLKNRATVLLCRCYPEFASEPFWPITDLIARLSYSQPIEHKLRGNDLESLLAELNHATQRANLGSDANVSRQGAIAKLNTLLLQYSQTNPVCLIFEDIHWADPSTIDWLQSISNRLSESRCQLILTSREPELTWAPVQLTPIELNPLSAQESRSLVKSFMGADVEASVVEGILERSSGLPLYLSLLSRNFKTGQKVPPRLQDLVMQQLDSVGAGKRMAQLLSVLGSKCNAQEIAVFYEALSRETLRNEVYDLDDYQKKLAKAQIIEPRADVIQFRHALIQEIVYDSMWETDRRLLHAFCAKQLIENSDQVASETNTLTITEIARHLELCGKAESAIEWHVKAGKLFKARDAHLESIVQLRKALQLIEKTSAGADLKGKKEAQLAARQALELSVSLNLAGQLVATKGYGSREVESIYLRAKSLAEHLMDKRSLFRTLLGLEAYYLMLAQFNKARTFAEQASQLTQYDPSPIPHAAIAVAMGNICHHEGKAQVAIDMFTKCLNVCQTMDRQTRLVQSPEVIASMYLAVVLWETGRVDEALQRARSGVIKARELGQKLALCQALGMQAMVQLWCGDVVNALKGAEEAMRFGETGQLEMWFAHAKIMKGLCLIRVERFNEGFQCIESAYKLWTQTGTVLTRSFYLTVWAESCLRANKPLKALALVDEALALVTTHAERYYAPEVLRIRALTELALLQERHSTGQTAPSRERARELLHLSLRTARELGYGSLALRAAISLGSYFKEQSAVREALAGVSGGTDSQDFRLATELLSSVE